MRTTCTLDDDVMAAVSRLQREEGVGISEAVNRLIRHALASSPRREPYEHQVADVGITVDVSDIGAVLELLDES